MGKGKEEAKDRVREREIDQVKKSGVHSAGNELKKISFFAN